MRQAKKMGIFHERLNELYQEAHALDYTIGRKKFAIQLRVSRGQINGWLDGVSMPSFEMMKKIAQYLGVDVTWLIGETDQRGFLPRCFVGLPKEADEDYQKLLQYLQMRRGQKQLRQHPPLY